MASPVRRNVVLPEHFGALSGSRSPRRRRPSSISLRRDASERSEGDSQTSSPRTTSDAVLLRCRDTIERLHSDVEEERQKRTRLQDQVVACENELAAAKVDLAEEQVRCRDAESRCTRLERQLADTEQRLKSQKDAFEDAHSQAQQLKSESLQKAQEHFAQSLRLTELESATKRAEARAARGQEETARLAAELKQVQSKATTLESEVARLHEALEGKAQEAARVLHIGQEHEDRCEALQRELEDLHADKDADRAALDGHQLELQEMALRQERLHAAWKEREVEVQRLQKERDEAREEAEALQHELESSQQQARRVAEEQREQLEKLGRLEAERSKLRRQAEEARRQAADRSEDLDRLERQRTSHGTTVATLEQQIDEFRRQLRDRSQELARQKAEHQKAQQQLDEARMVEEQKTKLAASAKEAQKRASELTWRLEAANKEVEGSRERCKDLEQQLQQRDDKVRRNDVNSLSDMLARAHRHAELLAKMQAELGRKSRVLSEEEQESRDQLGTLKQKYEQKIAKLHLHLSEREACERKLKGFIENEIDILHQYNKELEDYCRWRRGGWLESACTASGPLPSKGQRLLQKLQNLEEP